MKSDNLKVGKSGEADACRFLLEKGFKILGKNVRNKWGEIDILAEDNGVIVVVEVKAKTNTDFGLPQEMVNFKKQRKLRLLARGIELEYPGKTVRVDVVAILYLAEKTEIEYIRNAVEG